MKITEVTSFRVEVPLTPEQEGRHCYNRTGITRIRTDAGIIGYGFAECDAAAAGELLVGRDPLLIEAHIQAGLGAWYGAENALWDIAGKAAGLPLRHLLGACRDEVPLYLTCVWPGAADQTDVTPRQQAEDIARYAAAGFRAVKMRVWRPDPLEDVETIRLVRQLVGGRDRMEVMVDRTGQYAGTTWDYATGLRVARALEEVDCSWLEEPFQRGDIALHARLRRETYIPITGGEHQPLDVYWPYLKGEAFDIVQPHCANVYLHLKKIAGLAELAGVECIFHGSHGLDLAGSLQLTATIPSCRIHEVVYTTPPAMPWEAWAPLGALVRGGRLFDVRQGSVQLSATPGLGVDLDEEALERYRVNP
ncbi:MAG: mandelate racemase/muconate lactonizing enzyme family protein [Gemmatimonadota bacterium]